MILLQHNMQHDLQHDLQRNLQRNLKHDLLQHDLCILTHAERVVIGLTAEIVNITSHLDNEIYSYIWVTTVIRFLA